MVLPGKTSSGGAAAPKGVAQRTSRQQLQTELPAERQVSGWTRALKWLRLSCWRAALSGVWEWYKHMWAWLVELPPINVTIPVYSLYPGLKQDTELQITPAVVRLVRELLHNITLHIIHFNIFWCINRLQHICALSLVQLLWEAEIIHSNDLIFIYKLDEFIRSNIVKQLASWS